MSFAATRTSPGHAWLDPALMLADIAAVRQHVDYLIVFMHWGIEYSSADSAEQQSAARRAVEAGADFVVGSHPHVVQPSETYGGKPIVYSLGNFVFDEMYEDSVRRGEVVTLAVQGSKLLDWRLRTSYIAGGDGAPRWASAG
jgi:poly-gamma-glutamate synthesis protein (capsule biosynthesis protein)